MDTLKALIVDDEPLAHEIILDYLKNEKDISVVQQCYSATSALKYLANHSVDLLFLDINMPKLSGIEMLRVLKEQPRTIITSAHREYALDGYELDVCDYLLKPIREERFYQSIAKARENLNARSLSKIKNQELKKKETSKLFVKVDRSLIAIDLSNIKYCEAYGNYVKIWTLDKMYLTYSSLTQFESKLNEVSEQFWRVQKSYIVNINFVDRIDNNTLHIKPDTMIPIGKAYKKVFSDLVQSLSNRYED